MITMMNYLIGFLAFAALATGAIAWLFRTGRLGSVTLQDRLDASDGYVIGENLQRLVGKYAIAHTVLRPVGKIVIEGKYFDASTVDASFIDKGTEVEILSVESGEFRVKAVANKQLK